MNIAIVGCGYVSDHYMETLQRHPLLTLKGVVDLIEDRARLLESQYGVHVYPNTDAVMNDPEVQIIVNLTDPGDHYQVSKQAILSGKHVYSEKPLSPNFDEAKELIELAQQHNVLLSSAPCSVLSEAAQTMWHAVNDGAIGTPRLVYAELDDNPIYLMKPEGWKNARGVPWPYINEYEVGCTLEHAGYYLTWLAAMFGPAKSVTSFSSCSAPDKTDIPMTPADTPDFSVGCIEFVSGVVARLTCSIVAPYDHRFKIIGNEGVLSVDECWQYGTPVYLERFSQLSLNARKSRTVRSSTFLQRVFGIRGKKQRFTSKPYTPGRQMWKEVINGKRSIRKAIMHMVSKRELVSMDFFRGVEEMAKAIKGKRNCLLSPEFVLHVNELTLAIQNSGTNGSAYELTTTFEQQSPMPKDEGHPGFKNTGDNGLMAKYIEWIIARLHKH